MDAMGKNGSPKAAARIVKKPDTKPRTKAAARSVRTDFGLALPMFAKMVHVPAAVLASWEGDDGLLDAEAEDRVAEVGTILAGLARVMRRQFIPTWLARPNDACKEIGVRTPLDLFKRGKYKAVEDMVFYMESGSPE
jgi:hypothetical protein